MSNIRGNEDRIIDIVSIYSWYYSLQTVHKVLIEHKGYSLTYKSILFAIESAMFVRDDITAQSSSLPIITQNHTLVKHVNIMIEQVQVEISTTTGKLSQNVIDGRLKHKR